ncbi:MAG: glycosyltransferase family 4 protein [Planctomycetes bacterium]|nr:glycosyltransferase family 4 protein [Planctomycetota bacterium]
MYLVKVPGVTLLRELAAIPGLRVLMDFNDTIWLPWQKASAWEGLEEMISIADGIVCENQFVAEYARRFNPVVHLVPDCAQVAVFDDLRGSVARNEDTVRLGWIGSAGTASSLYRVWEPLEALSVRYPQVELRILGASPEHLPRFEHVKWSTVSSYDQKTMVREALAMDVGIFPLFHVTESIGRGNGKTVLYMAAEAATVSEGIGENVQLIKDGVNGLLASTSDEWLAKLDWLVAHREDRRRIARAGLQTVREELSDLSCFSQLIGALDSVMESSTAEETHRGRV